MALTERPEGLLTAGWTPFEQRRPQRLKKTSAPTCTPIARTTSSGTPSASNSRVLQR
jgi:hypothetical protein